MIENGRWRGLIAGLLACAAVACGEDGAGDAATTSGVASDGGEDGDGGSAGGGDGGASTSSAGGGGGSVSSATGGGAGGPGPGGTTSSTSSSTSMSTGGGCAAGERVCAAGVLQTCADGAWEDRACINGCATDTNCRHATQPGAPWPMVQGGVQHRNELDNVGPATAAVTWTASVQLGSDFDVPHGLVVAADGTIYATSWGGTLSAVAPDGEVLWSGLDAPVGKPAIGADGTVYVGGEEGLCAFDPDDGATRWCVDHRAWDFTFTQDGALILGDYAMTVVDPASGTVSASLDPFPNDSIVDALAVGPDGTLFAHARGDLAALGPDGGTLWLNEITAAITGSDALVVGADGTIHRLVEHRVLATSNTGEGLWSAGFDAAHRTTSPTVGADGTVYLLVTHSDLTASAHAFHADGSLWWSADLPSSAGQAPVVDAEGTLYVVVSGCARVYSSFSCPPDATGSLLRFAQQPDGTELTATPTWSAPLPSTATRSHLAFRADELLVMTDDGTLLGFED